MKMKHAVIVAHPSPQSFNLAVARVYCEAVRSRGHEPILRDLYRMKFDPCLAQDEIPGTAGFAPRADVVEERKLIGDANVFAFIYPFWFNAPPAILKGYLDRVFGLGFAYAPASGGTRPLLAGRRTISFTSSGAPDRWIRQTAGLEASRRLIDEHFAEVCGLVCVAHIHFGGIVAGIRTDVVERALDTVKTEVNTYFQR